MAIPEHHHQRPPGVVMPGAPDQIFRGMVMKGRKPELPAMPPQESKGPDVSTATDYYVDYPITFRLRDVWAFPVVALAILAKEFNHRVIQRGFPPHD
jgi:hypothetical protein